MADKTEIRQLVEGLEILEQYQGDEYEFYVRGYADRVEVTIGDVKPSAEHREQLEELGWRHAWGGAWYWE